MAEPQACYGLSRSLYRLIVELAHYTDTEYVADGLLLAYTRNPLIAAKAAEYGFTVQWKPYLLPHRSVRLSDNGWVLRDAADEHARFEIDTDSVFGIEVAWVNPAIIEQIQQAKVKT